MTPDLLAMLFFTSLDDALSEDMLYLICKNNNRVTVDYILKKKPMKMNQISYPPILSIFNDNFFKTGVNFRF